MKNKNIFDSFNHAISGIVHGIKTQRNLKLHSLAAIVMLTLSLFYKFDILETLILIITIVLVMVAELINTAIENVVDLTVKEYHPLAKIAKDVAAGAVLLTALNAIIVGYFLFIKRPGLEKTITGLMTKLEYPSIYVAGISIFIVLIVVFIAKANYGKGTPLHGGVVSGHSAVAFAISTSICLITKDFFITILSLLLSLLVAQSRVEGRIHNKLQVFIGALVGISVVLFIFSLTNLKI